MDIKSFAVGMLVAVVICIATISSAEVFCDKSIIRECNLIENDVIDTEFEHLMIENRVKAYERGYYTCLQDTRPDLYKAYVDCSIQLKHVVGDPAFEKIVDAECAKNNINAQDKEYLCTLLTN